MKVMEKMMMMFTSDDYPHTIKIPADYKDTVKSDDDKKVMIIHLPSKFRLIMKIMQKVMMMFKSDDHPLTIKSPSPSESFTTRRGRATGESFLCGLLASRFRKAKAETVIWCIS